MQEETKCFIKEIGIFLAASIIGGFIGGLMGGLMSKCCCSHNCHHHFHKHKINMMGAMPMDRQKAPMAREFQGGKAPEFEGAFVEEEYVIIPKGEFKKNFKK